MLPKQRRCPRVLVSQRNHAISRICLTFTLGLAIVSAIAAEPDVDSTLLPRVPPTEPAKALSTFRVKPGFRLELAAAEPLVVSPVAMCFDEEGRLYVIEMRDYSERRPERLGRVRLLEDTDGDGRFEKSTVFAEGLPWPTAAICWEGGVFVGATPDILYFKDTDGDGKADVRETIFTGFANDYAPFATNKLNVQALMNSFNWSLDNRIHGATSFSGGRVKLVDTPFTRRWLERHGADPHSAFRIPQSWDLRGRDFSFDPRTLTMRLESGGGQHGMSFDNRGRKFVCSNSDHIQMILYEDRYAARNPNFSMPSPRVSIAADGPAAEVFRLSPEEPWRVLRTQWRVSGLVPGPIEGGGRSSGYFTGATGLTIYRGDAFGEDFVGDAFIGDAGGNLVHRKKLRPDGMLWRAERPADEQKVEFLASTDNWFRPVQFANAPDGCLYLADMYREVIEHPWSLPANLKRHLDLNSGQDRGRIYRIVPEEFKLPPTPHLRTNTSQALVKLLAHPNGWHRDTAARLLVERQDKAVLPDLSALLGSSGTNVGRIHALYLLASLGSLEKKHVSGPGGTYFSDLEEHRMKLADPFLASPSSNLLAGLTVYAQAAGRPFLDASLDFQNALTIGGLPPPEKTRLLGDLLHSLAMSRTRTPSDREWIHAAVMNSAGNDALSLLLVIREHFLRAQAEGWVPPFALLGRVIGTRAKPAEIATVMEFTTSLLPIPPEGGSGTKIRVALELAAGLDAGLGENGRSLRQFALTNDLGGLVYWARAYAKEKQLPDGYQRSAIKALAIASYGEVRTSLFELLSTNEPAAELRKLAFATLTRFPDRDAVPDLLLHWRELAPALRRDVIEFLTRHPERIRWLLEAVKQGRVPATELSITQQEQLRSHRDQAIREAAREVFGQAMTTSRQAVIERFQPALGLGGNSANGHRLFLERCASCHKLGNEGHTLGPDLATVKFAGREKLLIAILDPNREVAPNFASYSVETRDGEALTGVLVSESAASVTLRMAGGGDTIIARANIASWQSQGRSLMPEGLEAGLGSQDLADLFEFILAP